MKNQRIILSDNGEMVTIIYNFAYNFELPLEIIKLPNIKTLNIIHNVSHAITDIKINIPQEICTMTSLRNLQIGGNVEDGIEHIVKLTNLETLELSCISYLPETIGNLIHLKKLSIWNADIKLPKNITKLINLQHLVLDHCNIRQLPQDFGNLKELEVCSLWSNLLCELPESIINLTKLRSIDISYNKFKNVPAFLTKLKEVNEILYIDCRKSPYK